MQFSVGGEGAGREPISKLNLMVKQSYKIRELNLFLEVGALSRENFSKSRILHILVVKKLYCYIFCFYHIV